MCNKGLMDSLDVDYVGEDDRFYGDPVNWLNESYSHEKELPSHIVIYDLLEKVKSGYLMFITCVAFVVCMILC